MGKKRNASGIKFLKKGDAELSHELVDGVDKACILILECMDLNKITKSEGVSAMATLLTSILNEYENPEHFFTIIEMMKESFQRERAQ